MVIFSKLTLVANAMLVREICRAKYDANGGVARWYLSRIIKS